MVTLDPRKFLQKLNGHASEPLSLSETLAQNGRDRAAVTAEIEELNARRKQALLDDAADSVLDRIERELDRGAIRLEKLTLAGQQLRQQLVIATAEERGKRWAALDAAYREAAAKFIAYGRTTIAAHDLVLSLAEQARREGFESEAQTHMPATPNINANALLAPDLLDAFQRATAPRRAITVTPPAPQPAFRAPAPQPTLQHGVSLAPQEPQSWFAPRAQDDDAPLEAGEVRAIVLRAGYSANGRTLSHAGHRVRLPREIAMAAARAGAVEILETSGGHAQ